MEEGRNLSGNSEEFWERDSPLERLSTIFYCSFFLDINSIGFPDLGSYHNVTEFKLLVEGNINLKAKN